MANTGASPRRPHLRLPALPQGERSHALVAGLLRTLAFVVLFLLATRVLTLLG